MAEVCRLPAGWAGVELDEVDYTNAEALRRAAAGARGPLWITARRQTAGRGRAGRSWTSAEGSLAATLLLEPDCEPAALPGLSLVAGLAAHDAIAPLVPPANRPSVRLKWPNDVLIGGAKACGILIESTLAGGRAVAAIGIGINVAAAPQLARPATSLAAGGAHPDLARLGLDLAAALAHWLAVWAEGRRLAVVRAAWLDRSAALGTPMTVNAGSEQLAGTFAGLDGDGALLLDTGSGYARRFTFGDVALGTPQSSD